MRSAQRLSSRLPDRWDRLVREAGKIIINYRGARGHGLKAVQFALAGRHSDLLLAPFGERRMLADVRDREVGRNVYIRGNFERIYMQTAVEYLREKTTLDVTDTVFVDVGANIGTSTVDALLHFGFAKAICLEPDTNNFRLLRMNLLLNDLEDRTIALRRAASDEDGNAILRLSLENSGDHHLLPESAAPAAPATNVECSRLESLVTQGLIDPRQVGLLWVETQGFEAFVLRGATSLIDAGVPVVVEYCPAALEATGSLDALEELIVANFSTVVDLRLLSHGIVGDAVLNADQIGRLRQRFRINELTDLLLIK